MSELEAAAAVKAINMEVLGDEDIRSGAQFAEYTDDITQRPINQGTLAGKANESVNPTANGARVSAFHTLSRPICIWPRCPRRRR